MRVRDKADSKGRRKNAACVRKLVRIARHGCESTSPHAVGFSQQARRRGAESGSASLAFDGAISTCSSRGRKGWKGADTQG